MMKRLAGLLAVAASAVLAFPLQAQTPRYGGELIYPVPSEPPSYDGHREETFGLIHPFAPFYNTLLRVDPFDKSGTKPYPSLAESWTVSADGKTYTFKLRRGVKFHDGSDMTSRDVKASYDKITVQESPWDCILLVGINHEKKPFDDKRVRRALTLALDRHQASESLSRIAIVKSVAGVQVPGTPFATPPDELNKLAGYWTDINKSRAEARRLLKEAGVPEGFAFTFTNRGLPMPYEPLGVWMIDQWRQIGLNVKQEVNEPASYFGAIRRGTSQVHMDFQCGYIVEPDLDMYKFLSFDRNPANYARYKDPVLDDLYDQQSRATNVEERKRLIRAFEKRLLDEEAHYLMTLQWHRIIPHSAKVKGWTVTPSHYLNTTLDTVWLSE